MVKKLKADALMIKELLKKGYKQCQISLLLGIKKEKVSYWARHELRTSQEKSKKLKDITSPVTNGYLLYPLVTGF